MSRMMLCVLAAICLEHHVALAQATKVDSAEVRHVLSQALAPLRSLNQAQLAAVAGLVVASRSGIDVSDYCPPLRSVNYSRPGCIDAEMAYASAGAKCKERDESKCPDMVEAGARLMDCRMKAFRALYPPLHDLGLPGIPPKPRRGTPR